MIRGRDIVDNSISVDTVLNEYDLRDAIFSFIPLSKANNALFKPRENKYLDVIACVSKVWNQDAMSIKKKRIEKNFVSMKTNGNLKTLDNVIQCVATYKLTMVNLKDFKLVLSDAFCVQNLFDKCNGLKSLHLEFTGINDTKLNNVTTVCSTLEWINLERNVISDVGLLNLIEKCPNLLSLFLGNTHNVTGAKLPTLLEKCSHLQSLSLENIDITDEELENISSKCPKLKSLNISFTKITDVGLESLFKNCKNLESLDLTSLKGITDTGLSKILNNYPGLHSLTLRFTNVSEKGFEGVQENTTLQELSLGETQFTDAGMEGVLQKCSGLKTLDILYQPKNATVDGVKKIIEKYSKVTVIVGN